MLLLSSRGFGAPRASLRLPGAASSGVKGLSIAVRRPAAALDPRASPVMTAGMAGGAEPVPFPDAVGPCAGQIRKAEGALRFPRMAS